MLKRKVVVTGMGSISPFGNGFPALWRGLQSGICPLSLLEEDRLISGTGFRVAGLVPPLKDIKNIPREFRRTMSPMSLFACLAAKEALEQAGFKNGEIPRMGVCVGSTMGSGQELQALFSSFLPSGNVESIRATTFFKTMGHTASAGLALAFGLTGRLINPVAACAAGLQSIGLAYETIAFGKEDRMLCGGTEEYIPLTSATFDKIGASSSSSDPIVASRPFDLRRDGIVCSEGAGVLVLEEWESAIANGHKPLAEIKGFATRCSAKSMVHPDTDAIIDCMNEVLEDAKMSTEDIAYVNAHATATLAGDMSEGRAIARLFGNGIPVGSLKGSLGHAMAAGGALETEACIQMINEKKICPPRADLEPDPECGLLNLRPANLALKGPVLKNSFALGGVHASLILSPCR